MAENVTVKRGWNEIAGKLKSAVVGMVIGGSATVAGLDAVLLWLWNGVFNLGGTPAQMSDAVAAIIGTILGGFIVSYFTPEKLPVGTTGQTPSGVTTGISGDIKTPTVQAAERRG